jgi:hypothetical protein
MLLLTGSVAEALASPCCAQPIIKQIVREVDGNITRHCAGQPDFFSDYHVCFASQLSNLLM